MRTRIRVDKEPKVRTSISHITLTIHTTPTNNRNTTTNCTIILTLGSRCLSNKYTPTLVITAPIIAPNTICKMFIALSFKD